MSESSLSIGTKNTNLYDKISKEKRMKDKDSEEKQTKKDIIRSEGEGFGIISKTTPKKANKEKTYSKQNKKK